MYIDYCLYKSNRNNYYLSKKWRRDCLEDDTEGDKNID